MPSLHPYTPADREACLAIFDSNCPEFLHADERPDFESWLSKPEGTYLVLEMNHEIVACGGFAVEPEAPCLTLTWGLVHGDYHGRRLGTLLLLERLVRGLDAGGTTHAQLGTAPLTEAFFARVGFKSLTRTPDGWAPGLDRVDMRLEWTPESSSKLRRQLTDLRARISEAAL